MKNVKWIETNNCPNSCPVCGATVMQNNMFCYCVACDWEADKW